MFQKPLVEYKNTADFLKKDKDRLINEKNKKDDLLKQIEKDRQETVKKRKEERVCEFNRWENFYDGDGLNKMMYFTWSYGKEFFLSPNEDPNHEHNYIWSDPEYQGDGTIRCYNGTIKQYFGSSGRCKGCHRIVDFCGSNTTFIE